ncbi:Alpha/Beta hydrolase protein [Microdochium trichocladiopsis]|uniref:Carboxylic ester hydrolase n=1 Tax=Microdochium trichocladiopsis TaxID=1682393 RepID=A0A9P8Y3R3_9PEZI|nr:Alpha/Beta hydrolase protein [Microdochium trichocladiopsis]KAH7029042.1 Alpha/Beta hydrolase protein [Microdochium trichocladiopsis]
MKASLSIVGLAAAAARLAVAAPHRSINGRDNTVATVNLDYEVHQGNLNVTGGYYIFDNIPYAQQPVNELRFAKPQPITATSSTLNVGGGGDLQCIQSYPQWIIDLQARSNGISSELMAQVLYNQAGQTEECLLLNVYVPQKIFAKGDRAKASVLVWIHGGGFTFGSKTSVGNPAGIIARAGLDDDKGGIIFVSINYRLGLFGWLAGSDVTPNLGLYDQRAALDWVQKYISRFGGDPARVTIMGESAGGSSITHHITAYGGGDKLPFRAAIPQSPAFQFNIDTDATYKKTLAQATTESQQSVSSVAGLKSLTTDQLKSVNQKVTQAAIYGGFNFGVSVDGTYVPELPQVLFAKGKFNKGLDLLIAHMPITSEAAPFVPPTIATAADLRTYAEQSLATSSSAVIDELLTDVYPDVMDGTYPWTTQFGRAVVIATELNFACVARYISTAYNGHTHSYIFAYPPAYHAGDVKYEFYNGDASTVVDGVPINPQIAYNLQDTLVRFARKGDPTVSGLPKFERYGKEGNVLHFSDKGVVAAIDDLKNPRCDWIQKALVDGRL